MSGEIRKGGRGQACDWKLRSLSAQPVQASPRRRCLQGTLAIVLGLGLAVSGPASAAPAATVVGNGDPSTCTQGALDTALATAGSITFNCGGSKIIALTTVKTISQDTTLNGGDVITLSGGFSTRLFAVNSGVRLTLQHLVLDGAASTGSDGGAITNHGALVLDHATIQHSQTDSAHSGGAIFSDGPVTITHSILRDNSGGSAGALFANFGQAVVTVSDSTFTGNEAVNALTGYGGAIWVGEQAQLSLAGGTLTSNTAQLGGGIYSISGTVGLADTALISNTATGSFGGGIDNQYGTLTLANTLFISNSVVGYGGGIETGNGVARLTNVSFSDNAAEYGGGLDLDGGAATLTNTTFISNAVSELGGGIATFGPATLTMFGGAITGNLAALNGGGIEAERSTLNLTNTSLSGNKAHIGGGIDTFNSGASLTNTSVISNSAFLFGGGLANAHGSVVLAAATLSGNLAGTGGAVYMDSGDLALTNTAISGNSAAKTGGALYAMSGTITVTKATLSGNTALFGAGIDDEGGDVTLTNATLSGNSAAKAGGGIWHAGGDMALTHVTLSGNAAFEGGGLDERSGLVTETLTLSNTILAAGTAGGNCFTPSLTPGAIISSGYNLSSDGTCASDLTRTGDLNNTNPHLGPLSNNGGPTLTNMPGAGSPAIDAIPAGANGCGTSLITDQRHFARPFHGQCDIGAVETGWIFPQLWLPLVRR